MFVSAIIAAGGTGARLGAGVPKQLIEIGGRSILQRSLDAFALSDRIHEIVVAATPGLAGARLEGAAKPVRVVEGGPRRQDSVASAFAAASARADFVVVHDAARPFVTADLIARTIDGALDTGAAIAALAARDTVKQSDGRGTIARTLPRETIYLAQTPQAFRREVLRDAIARGRSSATATDEATLAEEAGYHVRIVAGDPRNIKITTPADLELARLLAGESTARDRAAQAVTRVGVGYDLHCLVQDRPLILGGVTIPFERGLQGHSDADALSHAVTDAVLGAAAAGDIGRHFPDTDPVWKDASSLDLLARTATMIRERGLSVLSVDAVIIAERPRLAPHVPAMVANLAKAIGIEASCVSVKGKTNEGVGEIGRGEAIAVHAVALVGPVPS